jgi:hypothetical protein
MPAKFKFPSSFSKRLKKTSTPAGRTKKPLWLFGIIVLAGLAAWAHTASAATSSPTIATALMPALKLAVGTIDLEGTDQAVDSTSAARLLPLWQLVEQLDTSGTAAPEEITAVVNEIQLSMTSAQIKAIDAMSIDESQLAASGGSAPSTTANSSSPKTSAQEGSAAVDPSIGGMPGGSAPMDAGGGPMPSGSSQAGTSTSKTSNSAPVPVVMRQVIQLLETKVQS